MGATRGCCAPLLLGGACRRVGGTPPPPTCHTDTSSWRKGTSPRVSAALREALVTPLRVAASCQRAGPRSRVHGSPSATGRALAAAAGAARTACPRSWVRAGSPAGPCTHWDTPRSSVCSTSGTRARRIGNSQGRRCWRHAHGSTSGRWPLRATRPPARPPCRRHTSSGCDRSTVSGSGTRYRELPLDPGPPLRRRRSHQHRRRREARQSGAPCLALSLQYNWMADASSGARRSRVPSMYTYRPLGINVKIRDHARLPPT